MYGWAPGEEPAIAGPHLTRVARRRFEGPPTGIPSPGERAFLREYMSDLARPYGLALRDSVLEGTGGHRYEEMAEELIATLVPARHPVDLVVLAFAVPDVRAGRTATSYRGRRSPGDPLAFAICDQGPAAAYTGLRLIRELSRTGGCARSLLLILEQSSLPYQPSEPVTLPRQATAVGLVCDATGPARLVTDRQHPGVSPEQVTAVLNADLAEVCAGPSPVTLVLGDGLVGYPLVVPPVHQVRPAPPGQPSTGVWWELADALDVPGRMVLADYDESLGYLCLAVFESGKRLP